MNREPAGRQKDFMTKSKPKVAKPKSIRQVSIEEIATRLDEYFYYLSPGARVPAKELVDELVRRFELKNTAVKNLVNRLRYHRPLRYD